MSPRKSQSPAFAERLRNAQSVLAIAAAGLDECVQSFGAVGGAFELHRADGRPVLCVATDWYDAVALERYVTTGYRNDPCLRWVRQHEAPFVLSERLSPREARERAAEYGCPDASSMHTFIAPIFGDARVIGVLRVAYERAVADATRRDLVQLASHIAIRLAHLGFTRLDGAPLARLTPGQQRVAALVARGLTNAEIARELDVSVDGVKKHVKLALASLELANRAALAVAITRIAASTEAIGDRSEAAGFLVIQPRGDGP